MYAHLLDDIPYTNVINILKLNCQINPFPLNHIPNVLSTT